MSSRAAVSIAIAAVTACARTGSGDAVDTSGRGAPLTADTSTIGAASVPEDSTNASRQSPPLPAGSAAGAASSGRRPSGSATAGRAGTTPGRPAAPPASGGSAAAGPDTARGVVAVVGSTPITQVVLRQPGARSIALTGPLADEIRSASGADVWVRGRRVNDRTFDVATYAVRSVDGVTAFTGMLVADGDRLAVVTDDGRRHTIARPPAPLREHVGARVWVSGDLSTTITAYGVLRRR